MSSRNFDSGNYYLNKCKKESEFNIKTFVNLVNLNSEIKEYYINRWMNFNREKITNIVALTLKNDSENEKIETLSFKKIETKHIDGIVEKIKNLVLTGVFKKIENKNEQNLNNDLNNYVIPQLNVHMNRTTRPIVYVDNESIFVNSDGE